MPGSLSEPCWLGPELEPVEVGVGGADLDAPVRIDADDADDVLLPLFSLWLRWSNV